MGDQLDGDLATELAGTDDENPLMVEAGDPGALAQRPKAGADDDDTHHFERGKEGEEGAAVGEGIGAPARAGWPVPGGEAGEDQRAEDHCQQHGERFVDAAAPAAHLVETVEVEDDREEQQDARQHLEVAVELRNRLGERDDLELEAKQPRPEKRRQGGDEIARQIEGRRKAVSLLNHALRTGRFGATTARSDRIRSVNRWPKRSRPGVSGSID